MEEVAFKNQLAKINNLAFSFYLMTFRRFAGRLKVVHVMMLLILVQWKWWICLGFAHVSQNIKQYFSSKFLQANLYI